MNKRKEFVVTHLESNVLYMFDKIVKKENKTKSQFLLELLELWRKSK